MYERTHGGAGGEGGEASLFIIGSGDVSEGFRRMRDEGEGEGSGQVGKVTVWTLFQVHHLFELRVHLTRDIAGHQSLQPRDYAA